MAFGPCKDSCLSNARLVLAAVNERGEMRAALESFKSAYDRLANTGEWGQPFYSMESSGIEWLEANGVCAAYKKAIDALALHQRAQGKEGGL